MNGMRPEFIKKAVLSKSYSETPNPYVNAPSCHVNLLELSRYARKKGKKLADLSQEEVNQFLIWGAKRENRVAFVWVFK